MKTIAPTKERKPVQKQQNPRDAQDKLKETAKGYWRAETHVKREVQVTVVNKEKGPDGKLRDVESTESRYKWVKREGAPSLKQWARQAGNDANRIGDRQESAQRWLFNKATNSSSPPKRIGSTRKKSGSNSGSQKPAKAK